MRSAQHSTTARPEALREALTLPRRKTWTDPVARLGRGSAARLGLSGRDRSGATLLPVANFPPTFWCPLTIGHVISRVFGPAPVSTA